MKNTMPHPIKTLDSRASVLFAMSIISTTLAAQVPPTAPFTGLSGGAISVIASNRNSSAPQMAIAATGVGIYAAGTAKDALTGRPVEWAAQNCDACAWATSIAYDDDGRLWVAASGYGLWRGDNTGSFAEVKLNESNIVKYVARGSGSSMWAVLGNGVVKIGSADRTAWQGINGGSLGLETLALPSAEGGTSYAASASDVFSLDKSGSWVPLKIPASPTVISQLKGSLYAGTSNGVYQLSGARWTALGPSNTRVTGIALSSEGTLTIGTANGGMQHFTTGKWQTVDNGTGFVSKRVRALATDTNGVMYAALASGMDVLSGVSPTALASRGASAALAPSLAASQTLPGNDVRHAVTVGGDAFVLIPGQGVFGRVGKSNQWAAANDSLDDEPLHLVANGTAAYTLTFSGAIYRYVAPNGPSGGWVKLGAVTVVPNAFAVDRSETLWVAGPNGLVLSRDSAKGVWTSSGSGLERAGGVTQFLTLDDGAIYAATKGAGVYRWLNAKRSWAAVGGEGLPLVRIRGGQSRVPINALIADSATLFVGTNYGVFSVPMDADERVTWTRVGTDLPELTTTSLAIDTDGKLIAGTSGGAWAVSPNAMASGAAWAEYAGTRGEGVANLLRVGNEIIVATKSRPGRAGKVSVGRGG